MRSKRKVQRPEAQHQHTRRFQPTDNLHVLETQEKVKSQATKCEETKIYPDRNQLQGRAIQRINETNNSSLKR